MKDQTAIDLCREYAQIAIGLRALASKIFENRCTEKYSPDYDCGDPGCGPCWMDVADGTITADEMCDGCKRVVELRKDRNELRRKMQNIRRLIIRFGERVNR